MDEAKKNMKPEAVVQKPEAEESVKTEVKEDKKPEAEISKVKTKPAQDTQPEAADDETSEAEITDAIKTEPEAVDVIEEVPEAPEEVAHSTGRVVDKDSWKPKTALGLMVKNNEISDIDTILVSGQPIMESEIIDILLPDMKSELLLIGQSKGKFGGGQRRVFKQTQKKTREGNKPKFATFAVVGDENGHVGIGYGKSKETVPARESANRKAKKNIIRICRGCGSWECGCNTAHSLPFKVRGKCGSVIIELMPAPRGTGLVIQRDCAKILELAGIKDVWSKSYGQTKTTINLIQACFDALKNLTRTKIKETDKAKLGYLEGCIKENDA